MDGLPALSRADFLRPPSKYSLCGVHPVVSGVTPPYLKLFFWVANPIELLCTSTGTRTRSSWVKTRETNPYPIEALIMSRYHTYSSNTTLFALKFAATKHSW